MKTPTKIREQLEEILTHNSVEDVLNTLAAAIEEADEWADATYQVFAAKTIREASAQLRDEDWQRELDGE